MAFHFDQDPVHLASYHVLDSDTGRYLGVVSRHDGWWYAAPLVDRDNGCRPLRHESGGVRYVDTREAAVRLLMERDEAPPLA